MKVLPDIMDDKSFNQPEVLKNLIYVKNLIQNILQDQ